MWVCVYGSHIIFICIGIRVRAASQVKCQKYYVACSIDIQCGSNYFNALTCGSELFQFLVGRLDEI